MPLIMMTMSSVLAFPKRVGKELADPTLNMVGAAYAVMKILEFSVRRMLDEMVRCHSGRDHFLECNELNWKVYITN